MLMRMRAGVQGAFGKTVIWLIIGALSLFGFGAFTAFLSDEPQVAVVNGEKVFASELQRAAANRRRFLEERDADPSELDEGVVVADTLDSLVLGILLDQAAAAGSMVVVEAAIDEAIVTSEEFSEDGRFSPDLFVDILRSTGYTPVAYRQILAERMLRTQLEAGIRESGFVTPWELRNVFRLRAERRDIAWLILGRDKLQADGAADVAVEAADVATYYEANQEEFMVPEKVVVQYLEIFQTDLATGVEISEQEVRAAYESEFKAYQEQETRRAAHILLYIEEGRDEAAARAELMEIRQRIVAGESFAELARQHSQDSGSAAIGGDLGDATKGTYVTEFEEALWALQPGELSQPITTQFGVHLIRLEEISVQQAPTFEDSRAAIEQRLREERAGESYSAAKRSLAEISFESSDLEEPAQRLQLALQTSPPFPRGGSDQGLFNSRAVLAAVFSSDVYQDGFNSPVIEPEPGRALVLRLLTKLEARQQALAEVEEEIRGRLTTDLLQQRAMQLAGDVLKALRDGTSSRAVAAELGLSWERGEGISRWEEDVPTAIVDLAFSIDKPESADRSADLVTVEEGVAVVVVTGVHAGDHRTLTEDRLGVERQIQRYESVFHDWSAFERSLRAEASIERQLPPADSNY